MLEIQSLDKAKVTSLSEIEKLLENFLADSKKSTGKVISEMSTYQLKTGGKRLRAIVPGLVFEAFGEDPLKAVRLGAAVEMIHNATLVHDDLQDGDRMRRGQPTVWAKYSAAQAINCGDAMFQYAFQLLSTLELPADRLIRILRGASFSTLKVIEGQAQEFLMKEETSPSKTRYFDVIRGKTSGLISFPVVAALEAMGVADEICRTAEAFCSELGVLFQIQDDLLDIYGKKGREDRATDIAEGKVSFMVAHINEVAPALDKYELHRILKAPREQTSSTDVLTALELFERYDCKGAAFSEIDRIRSILEADTSLDGQPKLKILLLSLAELFLEPIQQLRARN